MPAGKAAERLRRLLVWVPYVVRHPGSRVAELARMFHVSEDELLSELNLLFVSGVPPYGPGDLIEVQVEDGRVWIDMADYFSRPLRLSRSEALALYLQGKALLGTPGLPEAEPLESALAKLEAELGPEMLGRLAGRVEAAEGGRPADTLEALRRAAADRRRLEIEYYSASRDATSVREIDPEEVFSAIGNWYVVAWDRQADGERMFRADRINTVRETGERFEPRGLAGAGRPLYTRSDQDVRVRLLLRPPARWVAEYYDVESINEHYDGTVEVTLPTRHLAWVAKLVVRLGGEATVVEPAALRDNVRDVARRALALYGQKS
ncbi:MAG: WYL domain-containing protein [Actinomycetota bacterium]|nr:WYL domain-containing protein [Actinomycetota bacterium]